MTLGSEVKNFDPRFKNFPEAKNKKDGVYCVYRDNTTYILFAKS
jgi:hypothetical protein